MRPFLRNKMLLLTPVVFAVAAWNAGSGPHPLAALLVLAVVAVVVSVAFQLRLGFNYLYPGSITVLPWLVFFWGGFSRVVASYQPFYATLMGFLLVIHLLFVFGNTVTDLTAASQKPAPKKPLPPKRKKRRP